MKNKLQIFCGIQAHLNIIELNHGLGVLKELVFSCQEEISEKIIGEAVKRGIPFERTIEGVKLFQ